MAKSRCRKLNAATLLISRALVIANASMSQALSHGQMTWQQRPSVVSVGEPKYHQPRTRRVVAACTEDYSIFGALPQATARPLGRPVRGFLARLWRSYFQLDASCTSPSQPPLVNLEHHTTVSVAFCRQRQGREVASSEDSGLVRP